ncbi:MAG TPA: sterol desaturase family protein [Nitrospirota bacterium]|nr:sterol desaturase family protein [Nitrospirota bacterium]
MDTKPVILFSVLVVIFIFEGIFPHRNGTRHRFQHGLPHVVTAVLNGLITRFLLLGITVLVIGWAEHRTLGLARLGALSGAGRMITVFILFDIWMYVWHRANHQIGFLWRFHRAHHSDTAMDTTTALRFHPGELVLSTFIRLPIIVLLGMSVEELVMFELVLNISTYFHHSNLAIPDAADRILRIVIVTPNMHRVHHSVVFDQTNSNYTSLLSVWDRLARSFRMRHDITAITFGLPWFREERYQRFWGFLITPFI